MSVIYRGPKIDSNYTINDFYKNGIVVTWMAKWYHYQTKKPEIRLIFRSNGLIGEIRSCCNGFAVDVCKDWFHGTYCLTTECKSVREAKSILFIWFRDNGFSKTNEQLDRIPYGYTLKFNNVQLNLNPFIFR